MFELLLLRFYMFTEDYSAPKRETLPTVAQYLKTLPKNTKALQQLFSVDIVWIPGKFDNFTLQTHAFRMIIPPKHPLYEHLTNALNSDEGLNSIGHFRIKIKDRETGDFILQPSKKKGQWEPIAKSGFRFPTDP